MTTCSKPEALTAALNGCSSWCSKDGGTPSSALLFRSTLLFETITGEEYFAIVSRGFLLLESREIIDFDLNLLKVLGWCDVSVDVDTIETAGVCSNVASTKNVEFSIGTMQRDSSEKNWGL